MNIRNLLAWCSIAHRRFAKVFLDDGGVGILSEHISSVIEWSPDICWIGDVKIWSWPGYVVEHAQIDCQGAIKVLFEAVLHRKQTRLSPRALFSFFSPFSFRTFHFTHGFTSSLSWSDAAFILSILLTNSLSCSLSISASFFRTFTSWTTLFAVLSFPNTTCIATTFSLNPRRDLARESSASDRWKKVGQNAILYERFTDFVNKSEKKFSLKQSENGCRTHRRK